MNFSLLNPWMLLGLGAAALPIIIHLTHVRVVKRKFSAVRILIESRRSASRPERLKHFLLLALRVLTVCAIALMIARPVMTRPGAIALGMEATVLIMDNSLSMGFLDEKGERYEEAKKAATEVLSAMEGQAAIVTTADDPSAGPARRIPRWMARQEALQELRGTSRTLGRGDPERALRVGYETLKGAKTGGQIVVVSDMARGDWERTIPPGSGAVPDVPVTFVRVGGPNRDPNFAVSAVSLADGEAVAGTAGRLEATVVSRADHKAELLVSLHLDGTKKDQKSIEVTPGGETRVSFETLFEKAGWGDGEIRIASDRLTADDQFFFPLKVRGKLRILVVDGDPKTSLKTAESYYLVSALNPGGPEGSPFSLKVTTEAELPVLDPRTFDALFLLNVATPDPRILASSLEAGKAVFLWMGEKVSLSHYNEMPFFPWRLQGVRQVEKGAERIGAVDEAGEGIGPLVKAGRFLESLKAASFRKYVEVAASPRNLLTLRSGDPLLAAHPGNVKLFLFASTADLDWNDLPLKTAYLPLVQRLTKVACGLAGDGIPQGLTTGHHLDGESARSLIRGSAGEPGIIQLQLSGGEARRGVNVPAEESDLTKISDEGLKKRVRGEVKVVEYREGGLKGSGGTQELWPFLLALVMAFLVVEMVVVRRS